MHARMAQPATPPFQHKSRRARGGAALPRRVLHGQPDPALRGGHTCSAHASTACGRDPWVLLYRLLCAVLCCAVLCCLQELMEDSLYTRLNEASQEDRGRVFGWYRRGWRVALDVAQALHALHTCAALFD